MSFTIASTVDEAIAAMTSGARPIAGGTDLVVAARHGSTALPDDLVAIDRLMELATIDAAAAGGVSVGALVTHATLMADRVVVDRYTALADASALVGSPATRNIGTLGGNVMNASPAMDTGAPLAVLGAEVVLRSAGGSRTVAVRDLWTGPGTTSASSDELCVRVDLPARPDRSGSAYVRLEYRRAMEIAVVGAAASVTLSGDDTIASLALALTAVAPTIVAVDVGELEGRSAAAVLADVGAAASERAAPISDLRASDRYRRHTIGVIARRAVDAAVRRASGETVAVPVNRSIGVGVAS